MTGKQTAAASIAIGLPMAWLALLETGLLHYWSLPAALLQLAVLVVCCTGAYLWLRYWETH